MKPIIFGRNYFSKKICTPRFRRKKLGSIFIYCLVLCNISCNKLVEVNTPSTSLSAANVYLNDATAISVLTGIYTQMSSASIPFLQGITSMSMYPGLSADELTLYNSLNSTNKKELLYYTNALDSRYAGFEFWNFIYPIIFITNTAIASLENSNTLTPAVKAQLLGEAKFVRAFYYFYLVNLYGDVPLVTGTDYTINAGLPRTPQIQVWQQIISDLRDAQVLLSQEFLDGTLLNSTEQRVRPTSWAATALLARCYLYTEKWDSAIAQATSLINNSALFNLDTLNGVFLANSNEAIWQLQPVNAGENTQDALTFILPSSGPDGINYLVYLNRNLVNSFEQGDHRRFNWVDSVIVGTDTFYFSYKYKVNTLGAPVTEYETIFRLGEQYLIRAEAQAEQNDLLGATSDLNIIRNRAGLPNITSAISASSTSLLTAILHERQVELFTEWGHRWLDLKRTNTVDLVMGAICPEKGGNWSTNWQLYPLPLTDLETDPSLMQNLGY